MGKASRGGEQRTAVWASHHEERCSDGVVAPPVCDHRVVPHRWVVFDRCNPSGSAVDACTVYIPQALMGRPVPRQKIHAQRVALFDRYRSRNCLPPQKLRREIQWVYSRCHYCGHGPRVPGHAQLYCVMRFLGCHRDEMADAMIHASLCMYRPQPPAPVRHKHQE